MALINFGPVLALLVVAAASATWHAQVSKVVNEPYLDEVFHVRQAQVYCAGYFQTWDPKITTPPGLYIVSNIVFRLSGRCDIDVLRLSNVAALCLIVLEADQILRLLSRDFDKAQSDYWKSAHTAVNVALFPPLFFFSGLYYTDVQSLLMVLLVMHVILLQRQSAYGWTLPLGQALLGIFALLFRQTNVFWTAIFPVGLNALAVQYSSAKRRGAGETAGWFEDYIRTALNVVWATLSSLPTLTLSSLPSLIILSSFVGFVAYNGGVVLGDKSNHVATIHLPQMLYVWPFILFFSWPLVAQVLVFNDSKMKSGRELLAQRPRVWLLASSILLALLVIHYNTIIHPFTLADNRHYVFYVFKLLRRHWLLRYAAAPIYVISAWLCIATAESSSSTIGAPGDTKTPAHQTRTTEQRMGFILVWIATTALSLITAPLVEPRYLIVPWTMWRLFLSPAIQPKQSLMFETIWYILINLATGYIFLHRPFTWPHEPGYMQRFMW